MCLTGHRVIPARPTLSRARHRGRLTYPNAPNRVLGHPRSAYRPFPLWMLAHRPQRLALVLRRASVRAMPRNTLRPRKPRTGAVELTLMRPTAGRPEPPTDLDPDEARIWNDVIDSLPAHWMDRPGQLLLRGIVAQVAIARRQEARLRRLQAGSNDDADADGLAIAHAQLMKTIARLLTDLRATPRSRMPSRAAGVDFTRSTSERPWEYRAPKQLTQ